MSRPTFDRMKRVRRPGTELPRLKEPTHQRVSVAALASAPAAASAGPAGGSPGLAAGSPIAPLRRRGLPPLVLASASPRRTELLAQLGLRFRVAPARVTEVLASHLSPRELSLLNAGRKARAAARRFPNALILAADTLVCLGVRQFGKPATRAAAARTLAALAGHTHQVVTGVCLLHPRTGRETLFAETTDVTFRRLSPARIRAYLAAVNPLDKAGAYAIQEQGHLIIARIHGSYTNVVGLPLERLRAVLAAWPTAGARAHRRRN